MTAASAPRALVTGASSGIGAAIARRLLDDGWRVIGFDVAPASIEHPAFETRRVDLTDPDATVAAARAAIDATAFVHAAGFMRVAPLGSLDHGAARAMWVVHVEAAMRIADVVVPAMAARKAGRVVLVGSRVAHGVAGRSQYAAVKSALIGLAKSWAAEQVSNGVTVNVISPAATATAMLADPKRKTQPPKVPPIGRLILPEEVAALVGYLVSPLAAPVTGQEIQICGGASVVR